MVVEPEALPTVLSNTAAGGAQNGEGGGPVLFLLVLWASLPFGHVVKG